MPSLESSSHGDAASLGGWLDLTWIWAPLVALAVLLLFGIRSWAARQKKGDGVRPVAAAAPTPQAEPDLPRMLPVTILYATTTGTARAFANRMAKELFAMHVSGFHFRVTVCDVATYDVDALERETLLLVLLPTWTGGTPAPSAVGFAMHVHDLATDFRVSKDALRTLRFGIFGLGNREYGLDWCRAARELAADLTTLSASPIVPLGSGDDSADQERAFREWLDVLWPALCEIYAGEMGVTAALQASQGASSCAGCSSGLSSSAATYKVAKSWEEEEAQGFPDRVALSDGIRNRRGGGCSNPQCACGSTAPAPLGASAEDSPADRPYYAADGTVVTRRQWRKARREEREAAEAASRRKAATSRLADAALLSAGGAATATFKGNDGPGYDKDGGGAAGVAAAAAAGSDDDDSDDDSRGADDEGPGYVDEEDRINELMLAEADGVAAYDSGDDDDHAPAGAAPARKAASSDVDLEDLGPVLAAVADEKKADTTAALPPREMVTPAQRKALTKENYQIIGSHSAVKMCRWTKASLRGRGCCYKMTFYGIRSYLCMEATPSLACANKCVFCWRHHRNPVGREWRWVVDDPAMIVSESVRKHQRLVKQLRGLPGLRIDRWNEAFTVRHCALSLVGEPIMYPHINEMVRLLHERQISTFLVTNAQFPEHIASLGPVTQLYVSIDAATKDTLKAIDRPLFTDFYERFLGSLDALRVKQQRTVYRLTLVKGGNMDEMADYVALVHRGQPDLIEVKGVTWCGTSPGSNLTMQNVPWHHEVKAFCEQLTERLGEGYALACEHEHSCCVLIAKTRFRIGGRWHTHIDYERFNDLVTRFYKTGESFSAMDYVAPTPDWCLYGSPERGFDPRELRWRRQKDGSVKEIVYKSSESGCG